jgi:CRP-like cAMP-binding protein
MIAVRNRLEGREMVDLSKISRADVLRGLTSEDLTELGAIAAVQEFERRDRLFERGAEATTLYLATSGRYALTVELRSFDGQVEMAVEELGALDAFGWSSLVAPRTSIYSGYCTEDGAAVAFPRQELEALMTSNRRLGEELLRNLNELIGNRLRVLQQLWLEEVSQSSARVQHWSHSELSTQWATAMSPSGSRSVGLWRRRTSHSSTDV